MLSIIIPTLNEEKYLPRLLKSISEQKYTDSEIIVSDGNSRDKTVNIALKNKCKVVISKRKNPAIQRNEGAKIAKGEYLLFLDADTVLPKNFISNVVEEFMTKDLDVAGFYFHLNSDKMFYQIFSKWLYANCLLLEKFHTVSIGAAILSKRDAHMKIGGFNEKIFLGEDHLYSKAIVENGGKYELISSNPILYSIRRFEKEGPLKVLAKWYYAIAYYAFFGLEGKKIVKYKFGKN